MSFPGYSPALMRFTIICQPTGESTVPDTSSLAVPTGALAGSDGCSSHPAQFLSISIGLDFISLKVELAIMM